MVSDYFLVEDLLPSGVINAEGDMMVHVVNVFSDRLGLDTILVTISSLGQHVRTEWSFFPSKTAKGKSG